MKTSFLKLGFFALFFFGATCAAQAQPGPRHGGVCNCPPNTSCHCIRDVRPVPPPPPVPAPRILPPAPPAPLPPPPPRKSCHECDMLLHACHGNPHRCNEQFEMCMHDCRPDPPHHHPAPVQPPPGPNPHHHPGPGPHHR